MKPQDDSACRTAHLPNGGDAAGSMPPPPPSTPSRHTPAGSSCASRLRQGRRRLSAGARRHTSRQAPPSASGLMNSAACSCLGRVATSICPARRTFREGGTASSPWRPIRSAPAGAWPIRRALHPQRGLQHPRRFGGRAARTSVRALPHARHPHHLHLPAPIPQIRKVVPLRHRQ